MPDDLITSTDMANLYMVNRMFPSLPQKLHDVALGPPTQYLAELKIMGASLSYPLYKHSKNSLYSCPFTCKGLLDHWPVQAVILPLCHESVFLSHIHDVSLGGGHKGVCS